MNGISIFFDDGGVMNDNNRRSEQWKDLIAIFFCERYGGDPETWREANGKAMEVIIQEVDRLIANNIDLDYSVYRKHEDEIWMTQMFGHAGMAVPEGDHSILCREVERWITPQVKSAIPGIIPAIKQLKNEGYTLYTASGESSLVLEGYLQGMGIHELFTGLYGPDLVGIMKGGLDFYKRIFSHSGIDPRQAIVIDDKIEMLQLAGQLGAMTIHSCVLNEPAVNYEHYYYDLKDLSSIIDDLVNQ